jgi:hypothetical protein
MSGPGPLVRATVSHQRSLRPTDESRVVDYLTFGQATATTTQNGGGWRDRMGAIASIKVCDFDALAVGGVLLTVFRSVCRVEAPKGWAIWCDTRSAKRVRAQLVLRSVHSGDAEHPGQDAEASGCILRAHPAAHEVTHLKPARNEVPGGHRADWVHSVCGEAG